MPILRKHKKSLPNIYDLATWLFICVQILVNSNDWCRWRPCKVEGQCLLSGKLVAFLWWCHSESNQGHNKDNLFLWGWITISIYLRNGQVCFHVAWFPVNLCCQPSVSAGSESTNHGSKIFQENHIYSNHTQMILFTLFSNEFSVRALHVTVALHY